MRNVIDDGYVEDGYIAGQERLHGPLKFRFRPAVYEESLYFVCDRFLVKPEKEQATLKAALIREKLVEWDEVDAAGNIVHISTDNIRRLRWALFAALFGIVAGFGRPDPLPVAGDKADENDRDDFAARLLESESSGVPFRVVNEGVDEKN